MRIPIASALVLLISVATASAGQLLREISWQTLQAEDALHAGRIEPGGPGNGREQLKMELTKADSKPIPLFELDKPGITGSRYAIRGKICYQNVPKGGYLEMWSHFPDGGRFFTRTLAPQGLLKKIEGDSPWRDFALPFFTSQKEQRASKLAVNLVCDGGTVCLGSLLLVQYADNEEPLVMPGQWWSERAGGLLGGLAGGLLGCFGALIGILAGRGKAQAFVMRLTACIVVLGIAAIVMAGAALILSQPWAVYYPLLLLGVVAVGVTAPMRRMLRKRYEQIELRKMESLDVAAR